MADCKPRRSWDYTGCLQFGPISHRSVEEVSMPLIMPAQLKTFSDWIKD
jgi:hypothetical protein